MRRISWHQSPRPLPPTVSIIREDADKIQLFGCPDQPIPLALPVACGVGGGSESEGGAGAPPSRPRRRPSRSARDPNQAMAHRPHHHPSRQISLAWSGPDGRPVLAVPVLSAVTASRCMRSAAPALPFGGVQEARGLVLR
jgi:hypothetical protein